MRARVRDRGLFRYFQRRNHRTCLCGHAVHDAQEACLEYSAQPDYWLRMDRAVSMLCVSTFVVPAAAAQELGVLAALTSEACRTCRHAALEPLYSRSLDLEPSSPRNTGVVWYSERTWKTFAHEVGHNFGGRPPGSSCCLLHFADRSCVYDEAGHHSFEKGQGKTGGIMDYGDGTLNGIFQFNTQFRTRASLVQRLSPGRHFQLAVFPVGAESRKRRNLPDHQLHPSQML